MAELAQQTKLIHDSGLFDSSWYLSEYPDVISLQIDPVHHYLRFGALLKRDPGPGFSTAFYLRSNPDIAAAGVNPLVHFITHGRREGRAALPQALVAAHLNFRIDVVIPVFDALDDVRACLSSVARCRGGFDVRTIVVNDGSGAETSDWLTAFCAATPGFELVVHESNRGYTQAINTGLLTSTAQFVVLLNSDTIVTTGWLKGLTRCMASASDIGVVGPLSNAASWQSVPELFDADGAFAINALPEGITPDDMAAKVALASKREYPCVPFINGFCFMLKRDVIDAIGLMDDQLFPIGYGEENDYCMRASMAGFRLAVADDAYVFHAKSRSFGHARRKQLSTAGAAALESKYGKDVIAKLVRELRDNSQLELVRKRLARLAGRPGSKAEAPGSVAGMRILFLLPVRQVGGGSHSVVQEAAEMRLRGMQVQVAVLHDVKDRFVERYREIPGAEGLFVNIEEQVPPELGFDVVVATTCNSTLLLKSWCRKAPWLMPAYYVQDYEPLFFPEGSRNWKVARESYESVPRLVLFAKTAWIIAKLKAEHHVDAHKVAASLDRELFKPPASPRQCSETVVVAAMVRPQTPRRGAERTMRVLSRLVQLHPRGIQVHVFGCDGDVEEFLALERGFEHENHGELSRPEVAALLAGCDVFVDLSDYQAFGRTALEAMASGCAVVVPTHGGADEYAVDRVNAVVVDTFDEEECLARLDELCTDRAMRERHRAAALDTARGYSIGAATDSILCVLSNAWAEHRNLWRRNAGQGSSVAAIAGPAALAGFRERIRQLAGVASQEHASPYYDVLLAAVGNCHNTEPLRQALRTLEDVDSVRRGTIPRMVGPVVSIVMPVWNRAGTVRAAIESVLAQTYRKFELVICDDASDDDSVAAVEAYMRDPRIVLLRQPGRQGAAAARNRCLQAATGDLVAYLDSDNLWHPRYLELMVEALSRREGHVAAYASYFDLKFDERGYPELVAAKIQKFHLEDQIEKPFTDLNSFVHRRQLVDVFGGFDEELERRQDYDLIARYCWAREPLHVDHAINLYRRDKRLNQITFVQKDNVSAVDRIQQKINAYYQDGVPVKFPPWLRKITVISWDMSRNHFAKAYCVADALSRHMEVELLSFRFFEEEMFAPLSGLSPRFECKYFRGGDFPAFFNEMSRAVHAIEGDAIYCIKPRLSSLGVALLSNFHTGKPIFLEANDLETVVGSPKAGDVHVDVPLANVLDHLDEAMVPHAGIWSRALDPCVSGIPVIYTHNINLNIHYQNRALYMRNIKDEQLYDPSRIDRGAVRRELGMGPDDRVILFGGLVRKHKGIFEMVELIERLGDERYKLVVVGSRETPDLRKLSDRQREAIRILPPQPPDRMAALNHAADLVLLWLDPSVVAGHYQSPYKMSDAFAMGPAIVGSPTSDLADFAAKGLVWTVPFGDFDRLVQTIGEIFDDEPERLRRQARARSFFLREFTYNAVGPALALGASMIRNPNEVYPVSREFAEFFSRFHEAAGRQG